MSPIIKAYKYAQKNRLVKRGKDWYKEAFKFALYLSNTYHISTDKSCAIIAALSPGITWEQNKKDAEELARMYDLNLHNEAMTHYYFSTYSHNVLKAIEILNADKEPIEFFNNKKCGFKTRHFYLNVYKPAENTGVTIDRHAAAIAQGENKSEKKGLHRKAYYDLAGQYISAAKKLNLMPHELQAITWVAYKHAQDNNEEIY